MATEFTPGPWTAPTDHPSEVECPSGESVATCWHEGAAGMIVRLKGVLPCSLKESRANASLIAAAPDLYEALVMWLDRIKSPDGPDMQALLHMTDAALAKARGEQ